MPHHWPLNKTGLTLQYLKLSDIRQNVLYQDIGKVWPHWDALQLNGLPCDIDR